MKKRARITPFAKLVIAGLIFLGLRYVYLNKDDILSGDFLNFNDTVQTTKPNDTSDIESVISANIDTADIIKSDSVISYTDTLDIIIKQSGEALVLQSSGYSINILLNDTISQEDTIIFNAFENKKIFGRVIIE